MRSPIDWPAVVHLIRKDFDFTQVILGRILAVTAQTISNWESERARPDTMNGALLLAMYRGAVNNCSRTGAPTDMSKALALRLKQEAMLDPLGANADALSVYGVALMDLLITGTEIPVEFPRKLPRGKTPSVR